MAETKVLTLKFNARGGCTSLQIWLGTCRCKKCLVLFPHVSLAVAALIIVFALESAVELQSTQYLQGGSVLEAHWLLAGASR